MKSRFTVLERKFRYKSEIHTCWSLTFSRRTAHYGTTRNSSLHAASATGGRQALCHSWTRRTLACGMYEKKSTVEMLTLQGIQLLLIFTWGFQPPPWVINLAPASYLATPLVLEQRYRLQDFRSLSNFGYRPPHFKNDWKAWQDCAIVWSFGINYTKWIGGWR